MKEIELVNALGFLSNERKNVGYLMFVKRQQLPLLTDDSRVKVNFIYYLNCCYWFVLVADANDFAAAVVDDFVKIAVACTKNENSMNTRKTN